MTEGNLDRSLALSAPILHARIRELEAKLARYERSASLANALMSSSNRPAPMRQARVGRPVDLELPARQIAWAIASAPGGSIERWLQANDIELKPIGRVRSSAHSRIRTFVFVLFDMHEAQTRNVITEGRREQISTRLTGYAKAGRALLRQHPSHRELL